ncbi:hypothetical protein [Paenibacillus popilliae]|uniref:Uncharacterized protein n=1 Tax=Paenibacillus popilliae TaxID=78057 RepID=A0ABY3ALR4_PAEPP|nr:hypothetical protein [Paenibacillus sp. SDF0028]TQR42674.1 hypothetical protein C7Y44_21850 [Paenibacillus sp. SDF0028]
MNTKPAKKRKAWFAGVLTITFALSLFVNLLSTPVIRAAKDVEENEMDSIAMARSDLSARNMVFLYSGHFGDGQRYIPYESAELERLDTVRQFVIAIDNKTNKIDNYKKRNMIDDVNETVQTVVDTNSEYKVLVSLPAHDVTSKLNVDQLFDEYVSYIKELKRKLGSNWDSVTGFYYPNEAIYFYGTQNYSYSQLDNQSQVQLLEKLSRYIKNSDNVEGATSFAWAPYYGFGPNREKIVETIAYIVDETMIFDDVYIQPHYYFDKDSAINLQPIYDSVKEGRIYGDGGRLVAKNHLDKTKIGIQMEIDSGYFTDTGKRERYDQTVDKFKELLGEKGRFSFYMGSKGLINRFNIPYFKEILDKVNEFYTK